MTQATVRITPPHRRPDADPARFEKRTRVPHTIGIVDSPLHTGQLPALVEYSLRPSNPNYVGRHHRSRPGLFAWLLRWIGGRR